MTMRRENKAQEIELIKNELETKKMFLEKIVRKFEVTGYLTKEEREVAGTYANWIEKHAKIVKDFYKPAMVIAD